MPRTKTLIVVKIWRHINMPLKVAGLGYVDDYVSKVRRAGGALMGAPGREREDPPCVMG